MVEMKTVYRDDKGNVWEFCECTLRGNLFTHRVLRNGVPVDWLSVGHNPDERAAKFFADKFEKNRQPSSVNPIFVMLGFYEGVLTKQTAHLTLKGARDSLRKWIGIPKSITLEEWENAKDSDAPVDNSWYNESRDESMIVEIPVIQE